MSGYESKEGKTNFHSSRATIEIGVIYGVQTFEINERKKKKKKTCFVSIRHRVCIRVQS